MSGMSVLMLSMYAKRHKSPMPGVAALKNGPPLALSFSSKSLSTGHDATAIPRENLLGL